MPAEYNPNNVDGQTLTTTDLNQHIPQCVAHLLRRRNLFVREPCSTDRRGARRYCGSCWAHAALSSIADRIKIASKGAGRDVVPAVQVMIDCGDAGTCNGGDSMKAYEWVHKNGIPDITCAQCVAHLF